MFWVERSALQTVFFGVFTTNVDNYHFGDSLLLLWLFLKTFTTCVNPKGMKWSEKSQTHKVLSTSLRP